MKFAAYVSQFCPNCKRFVDCVKSSQQAQQDFTIVDIGTLGHDQLRRLTVVPTVQAKDGRIFAGTQAFDLLKEYQSDAPPQSVDVGTLGDLMYSEVSDDSCNPKSIGFYDAFVPLATTDG